MARLRTSLLAALLLAVPAWSDEREEATRLVEESFAALHQGDASSEGFAEAYDRGADLAERAIEIDPENADAHYALFCNLGKKAERSGLAARALRVFRLRGLLDRTLELDPRHAHAWEAKGEMLLRLPRLLGGSERRGVEALRNAARLAPEWAKPRLRLAEHQWEDGERAEAIELAREAAMLARKAGDDDLAASVDLPR